MNIFEAIEHIDGHIVLETADQVAAALILTELRSTKAQAMSNESREAFKRFLSLKTVTLFHPESPGVKVVVTRSWVGRLFKSPAFATLSECLGAKL